MAVDGMMTATVHFRGGKGHMVGHDSIGIVTALASIRRIVTAQNFRWSKWRAGHLALASVHRLWMAVDRTHSHWKSLIIGHEIVRIHSDVRVHRRGSDTWLKVVAVR